MKNLHYYFLVALLISLTTFSCRSNNASEASKETSKDSVATEEVLSFTVNDVTFNMILVKGGTFTMGATPEQGNDAEDDEKPAHEVTLSDYYIGETEVTQALYEAVMGENPADTKGADLPVVAVEGIDCDIFAEKLSKLTGRNFRLPTEAEWEYAARGGNKSKGYKYSGSDNIDEVAWYNDIEGDIHPVKSKAPNELGIYDMSGNVDEYCADDYANYTEESQTNPKVKSDKSEGQTVRGGNFAGGDAATCRVSKRILTTGYVFGSRGFRVVMTTEK